MGCAWPAALTAILLCRPHSRASVPACFKGNTRSSPNMVQGLAILGLHRGDHIEPDPSVTEVLPSAAAIPDRAAELKTSMATMREAIDLVEADVAVMIRDVLRACDAVHRGSQ